MFWQGQRYLLIALGLVWVISFVFAFLAASHSNSPLYTEALSKTKQKEESKNPVVIVQKYYTLCGHFAEEDLVINTKGESLDIDHLREKYPASEGWIINRTEDKIVFTLPVDMLCPNDRRKRHLKIKDGYLAIYKGPADTGGPLIEITGIKKDLLPENFQKKVEGNGMTFASEKELLQALESLDEYIP